MHIITAAGTSINNLIKSVNKAGYDADEIVLEPLASAQAVLTEEERELGIALVDIGGGTTDFVLFEQGSLRHTGVLAIGGNHITTDISIGLKTPNIAAEEIKLKYGASIADFINEDEQIEVPGIGGRPPRMEQRRNLVEYMQPRIEEILALVNNEIDKTGKKGSLGAGIVLTGGVSLTPYIADLASEVFNLPVRIGAPLGIKGLNDIVDSPIFSTAVGLTLYAQDNLPKLGPTNTKDEEKNRESVISRIRKWLDEFF